MSIARISPSLAQLVSIMGESEGKQDADFILTFIKYQDFALVDRALAKILGLHSLVSASYP